MDDIKISNNGNYVLYYFGSDNHASMIVQDIKRPDWQKEIPNVDTWKATFTEDSQFVIFTQNQDTLCIMTLKTGDIERIPQVKSFTLNHQSLVYQLNSQDQILTIRNLQTGIQRKYTDIDDYFCNNDGKVILLQKKTDNKIHNAHELQWLNVETNTINTIWKGEKAYNSIFNAISDECSFIEKKGDGDNTLWLYKQGDEKATVLVNDQTAGMEKGMLLNNSAPKFSKDGNFIFFQLISPPPAIDEKLDDNTKTVNVWHYNDKIIQRDQLNDLTNYYQAVIQKTNGRVIRLTNENESIASNFDNNNIDENILIKTNFNYDSDWLRDARSSLYLFNIKNDTRKVVNKNMTLDNGALSKSYVLYYDAGKQQYFTYNIRTGNTVNISKSIKEPLYDVEGDHPRVPSYYAPKSFIWLENDNAVVIYDRYDIWQIDPLGIRSPINITNGYGRKNHIIFRIIETKWNIDKYLKGGSLILSAFNLDSKENGFYSIDADKKKNPLQLSMGNHLDYVDLISPNSQLLYDFLPVKARDTNAYIIRRSSVTDAPNFFYTKDFKDYIQISHNQPQKEYNWMTSELVKWKLPDGKAAEGILYKPENFDPNKKYPIIFFLYERVANELNYWYDFEQSSGDMNIPYFVSNGYIVFRPDIYYKVGEPGASAYNSVMSAFEYLSHKPWIDMHHAGLQGHSFGGYEVNYLITATHSFTAAASASGPTDLCSIYSLSSYSRNMTETYQGRIGGTPWNKLNLYLKNSPFFQANKVTTPLLLMVGKNDSSVPPQQGIEYFWALRRLKKQVWLLEYENGGHQGGGMDYTIRLGQFFDHYLKDSIAPVWMTNGIKARLKGVDSGFEKRK
ncbi:prolyl oligopeptidase family serine peptidase [Chitinophaga oryziterrae]|uniref:prolyl oligopeptidase family serine peptidase n=1 Tax=Chitinophaga oryziterrae TaxID=1031224 RepID=UPI0014792811